MARCTAPVRGHSSASAAAACPACGGRSYGRSYNSYTPSYSSPSGGGSRRNSGGGGSSPTAKPRWSKSGSTVSYTPQQVRSLTPVREKVEELAETDLRDVFLCHAWDDRAGLAKELNDMLEAKDVKVWFSEKDIMLGQPLMRAIDKGLASSRIGLVLVTPAFLGKLKSEGIADKELSVLLAGDRLIPIVHGTTYEALREVSPMLASRSGLSTAEEPIEDVVEKLKELVSI